jgi:hypothetical protein
MEVTKLSAEHESKRCERVPARWRCLLKSRESACIMKEGISVCADLSQKIGRSDASVPEW